MASPDPGPHDDRAEVVCHYLTDNPSCLAIPMATHALHDLFGCFPTNNSDELSLIDDVERVDAEEFTGTLDFLTNRDALLLEHDSHLRAAGDLMQSGQRDG